MFVRERRALAPVSLFVVVLVGACGGAPPPKPPAQADVAPTKEAEDEDAKLDAAPDGPPKEIDCGDFTTCAVAGDGVPRCWGRDKQGELGTGKSKGERLKRGIVPGVGKVTKIALASRFGCALLEDKKVVCWGTGKIANDGKSLSEARATPVAGLEGVEELVASGAIACARGAAGVVCWGADEKTIGTPPKGTFTQIAAGFTHACGLEKGAVTCWGPGDWGGKGAFAKPGVTGVTQVVTGDRHGCVLTKAQTVQCWGMNDAGQLGTKADVQQHKKPVAVAGLAKVVRLAAGEASTCALLADGSVRCWGSNGEGELGLGARSPDERPSRINALSDVDQICLASAHGCALTKQGKMLCWGSNASGQLGDGTKERRPTPTPVAW